MEASDFYHRIDSANQLLKNLITKSQKIQSICVQIEQEKNPDVERYLLHRVQLKEYIEEIHHVQQKLESLSGEFDDFLQQ